MFEVGTNFRQYTYENIPRSKQQKNYYYENPQYNSISAGTPQEKKSNISAKRLAGIALGIGAIAAGTILFKKWNPKPIKVLAEHIDFIKADTIEDALKFAQNNFGVKLNVNGQLKTANWINESLVNLSNKTKGKVLLPKEIKICKLRKGVQGRYNPFTRTVSLAEYYFGSAFEKDFDIVKKHGYLPERLLNLYHEIGHGIHLTGSNIFNELIGTSGFKKKISACPNDLTEFIGGKYFTRCEGETYAQLFGKKMAEGKLPDYAEDLWRKIGGKY